MVLLETLIIAVAIGYIWVANVVRKYAHSYIREARAGGPTKYLRYEIWLSKHWYAWPLGVFQEWKDDTGKDREFIAKWQAEQDANDNPPYLYQ